MIIRKSAARDRADGRRRRRRRRHARAARGASLEPGITMAELDRIAEDYIRSHGGVPTSKGYKAPAASVPDRHLHLAERRDRPRHPGRLQGARGRHHLLRHRRDQGRPDRRLRRHLPRRGDLRRGAAPARRLPRRARRRDRGGPGRRGRRRHLRRRAGRSSRTPASRSCAASSATGSASHYHEDPQVPNFVTWYRGPQLVEGMTIAIEPMITAGGPEVHLHDDGWSISTDDGSLDGALRAHRRDHRRRPAGPDEGRQGSWYHDHSRGESRVFVRANTMTVPSNVRGGIGQQGREDRGRR